MSHLLIDPEQLSRALLNVGDRFATKDVSTQSSLQRAHGSLASHSHWHSFVGKALRRHETAIGIAYVDAGGTRGARWRKTTPASVSPAQVLPSTIVPAQPSSATPTLSRAIVSRSRSSRSLSEQLASTAPGETLRLGHGEFRENLVVSIPVTIVGRGHATLLQGIRGTGPTIHVRHAGVVLRDFDIEHLDDVGHGTAIFAETGTKPEWQNVRVFAGRVVGVTGLLTSRLDRLVVEANRGCVIEGADVCRDASPPRAPQSWQVAFDEYLLR